MASRQTRSMANMAKAAPGNPCPVPMSPGKAQTLTASPTASCSAAPAESAKSEATSAVQTEGVPAAAPGITEGEADSAGYLARNRGQLKKLYANWGGVSKAKPKTQTSLFDKCFAKEKGGFHLGRRTYTPNGVDPRWVLLPPKGDMNGGTFSAADCADGPSVKHAETLQDRFNAMSGEKGGNQKVCTLPLQLETAEDVKAYVVVEPETLLVCLETIADECPGLKFMIYEYEQPGSQPVMTTSSGGPYLILEPQRAVQRKRKPAAASSSQTRGSAQPSVVGHELAVAESDRRLVDVQGLREALVVQQETIQVEERKRALEMKDAYFERISALAFLETMRDPGTASTEGFREKVHGEMERATKEGLLRDVGSGSAPSNDQPAS